jgi:negative regulator of sigma E activity
MIALLVIDIAHLMAAMQRLPPTVIPRPTSPMFAFRNRSSKLTLQNRGWYLSPAATLVALCLLMPAGVMAQADVASPSGAFCELDTPAERALFKMLQASAHQRYDGTVLFERAGSRQFVTVSSLIDDAGHGVLRRMNAQADPGPESWPAPFDSPQRACDVASVYLPTLGPGRTVAGRATQRLTLRPRDTLRLTHLIDMDSETGLALAMATVGSEGKMLERYEYASVHYQSASRLDSAEVAQRGYERGRSVVPGYFVLSEDSDRGVFVVSDGLATASIFVEPLPPGAPLGEGAVIEGATLTYTRGVRSAAGGLLISVLGEVPVVTARLLADAVRSPREQS